MTEKQQELQRIDADVPAIADTPMAILRTAVEQGIDAASISMLAELAWKQQDRDAAKEFHDCLMRFQENMPPLVKSRRVDVASNRGSNYSYFFCPLDEIDRTVKPFLRDLGFSFSWDSREENGKMIVICTLRHDNGHKETASFIAPMASGSPAMSDIQKHASSHSYAKRQSLISVLGITTADADTDAADPTLVNEEQARTLDQLCAETNTDAARFLKWARADGFEEVLASRYAEAIAFLQRKQRG